MKVPQTDHNTTYTQNITTATRIGGVIGTSFLLGFTIYYQLSGYPFQAVILQVFAFVFSLSGLILIQFFQRRKMAAHLITLGLYTSLFGPGVFTGGIDSSAMVWLVFVPVVVALMDGNRASLFWSIITGLSLVGIFILNRVLRIDFTVRPSDSTDRFIDLACVMLATMLTTWLNETIKKKTMNQLETTQTRLENLTIIDPLTQIFNRRYFLNRAQEGLLFARANNLPISIILIDLDHFKQINDTHGHLTGDQVLCGAVEICKAVLRKVDILSRFGGEEFVVFLPETGPIEARGIAERLRTTLEQTPIPTDIGRLNITVSIGVADSNPNLNQSLQELIHQADIAMYHAKRAGRNQVIVWDSSLSTATPASIG